MNKLIYSLLFWTLILSACSTGLPATDVAPLAPESPLSTASGIFPDSATALPNPKIIQTLQTPHIDQSPLDIPIITPTYEGCGYMWAQKDLPEVNEILSEVIQNVHPDAKAWATAFGEDCVYADGHATFTALETDFYFQLTLADLSDQESLGNLIMQTLQIIETLPRDLIPGPQPGFVDFSFIKNATEQIVVRVPIQRYRDEATGKSGEELFRLFYTSP